MENKIWSNAYKQLFSSGIPNSNILHYTAPNRIGWNGQWLSQSLWMVTLEQLKMFNNVIMPDTDLFLSTSLSDKKLDTSNLWERGDRTLYASYEILKDRLREPKWDQYYELPVDKGKALFRKLMKQKIGKDITSVHHILAVINAFCPADLSWTFKEFVKENVQYIGSEEDMLSVYMQATGGELEDLRDTWGLEVANYLDDFNRLYDSEDFFFSHLRPAKLPTENDIERFMNTIGKHKGY